MGDYLRQHPQIFFSLPDEPRYLINNIIHNLPKADPMRNYLLRSSYLDWNSYIELFLKAKISEIRRGEGTTQYLYYHKEVIPKIKNILGDIPIIILLRNPVERAFSNYNFHKHIQLYSFEYTLQLEEKRKTQGYFSFWLYKEQGKYFNQVKAFLDNFSRVFIALTDDMRENPNKLMHDIYSFLGVEPNFAPNFNLKKNITKVPKNQIYRFIYFILHKSKIRFPLRSKLKDMLYTNNIDPIKTTTKKDLILFYKEDIKKLEQLIKRDLSGWYKNAQ